MTSSETLTTDTSTILSDGERQAGQPSRQKGPAGSGGAGGAVGRDAASPLALRIFAEDIRLIRSPEDWARFQRALSGGTIDLNPHQIDAALFAFRNPISNGAILADEVGLGKTIEAGLVIAQKWAEGRRRILILAPCSLRKQWQAELLDRFGLPSEVLDGASAPPASGRRGGRKAARAGVAGRSCERILITSYEFAYRRRKELARPGMWTGSAGITGADEWDLVVFDEAHRLRGVNRSGSKMARALRDTFAGRPKLLLTATPLQNNLMELHGLVSFIDDRLLGPEDAFRARFCSDDNGLSARNLEQLRERLSGIICRTLRRQVREYVKFTERHKITVDFTPGPVERELYEEVTDFLRRARFGGIGTAQRSLIVLVYHKLLGSSCRAVAATLAMMEEHLRAAAAGCEGEVVSERLLRAASEDVESLGEEIEEIAGGEEDAAEENADGPPGDASAAASSTRSGNGDPASIRPAVSPAEELAEITRLRRKAEAIRTEAKCEALASILPKLLDENERKGYPRKAVIFTESRRTQRLLLERLSMPDIGLAGRISILNGVNDGPEADRALRLWKKDVPPAETARAESREAAVRQAIVHEFRHYTTVLISTEAGGEGLNLQFANLLVNYDLPWNPQRIEQRIGRCHRYGQKFPVLVVNFINTANAAEKRVYELLDQKFHLFDGLFGSSDEILG
ncbi:MAG: DEAD/DEAH box helicase, partial [Planctomycetota bacterium]|nr:DEAD/DEAH box helicase [Planctomycetota bacterium]